jgi:hypothetical protein
VLNNTGNETDKIHTVWTTKQLKSRLLRCPKTNR